MEELKIFLDGSEMTVIRFGTGKKVLTIIAGISLCGIDGLGAGVEAAYQIFAEDYTVYLFDRKKSLPADYTTEQMAEDVYRVLTEHFGVKETCVYGVSHGGMMGFFLAINHPEFVVKLVVCSAMCKVTKKMAEYSEEWVRLSRAHAVRELNRSFFHCVLSRKYLDSIADQLPLMEQRGNAADCDRFLVLAKECGRFDCTDRIKEIRCPVLVLGDEKDAVIGPEGSREIAEQLQCELYMYDGYSHAVYDECPEIKERVKEFLER